MLPLPVPWVYEVLLYSDVYLSYLPTKSNFTYKTEKLFVELSKAKLYLFRYIYATTQLLLFHFHQRAVAARLS